MTCSRSPVLIPSLSAIACSVPAANGCPQNRDGGTSPLPASPAIPTLLTDLQPPPPPASLLSVPQIHPVLCCSSFSSNVTSLVAPSKWPPRERCHIQKIKIRTAAKLEFQVNNEFFFFFGVKYAPQIAANIWDIFILKIILYLKFLFLWASCILLGSLTPPQVRTTVSHFIIFVAISTIHNC